MRRNGDETMTGDDIRERILELADDIRDMGGRIANCDGEPNYSAEKAWRAAKAAVRIMAIADVRAGVTADESGRLSLLLASYAAERRDCRRSGIGERA